MGHRFLYHRFKTMPGPLRDNKRYRKSRENSAADAVRRTTLGMHVTIEEYLSLTLLSWARLVTSLNLLKFEFLF